MRRALVLAAVATLLVPPLSAPGSAQAQGVLDEIKQRGELRVAGVLYRPFISRRPNGDHVGIDVEVMRLFAQDLGVRLNIVPAEWATAVAGITTKRWDIVPATCITPARLEVVDFSESYLRIGAIFVTRSDNAKGLTSLEAFNRPTVTFAVPTGSWAESVAKEAAPQATLRGFGQSTSADLVQEVLAGRADAVVLDTPVQMTVARGAFGDRLAFFPGATTPLDVRPCRVGYAHAKGDMALNNALNAFIAKLRESGEMQRLFDRFMTPDQINATN